tara:strand:+ start:399 stop:947 length:549 start_codon:yes stop_codon:yes gene_type:complete
MSELRTNRIIPRDGLVSGTNNGGGIIQVRNIMYTDIFTSNHSHGGYVDVTGFNLNITPTRSDSKILVSAEVAGGLNSNYGYNFRFRVQRTVGGSVTSIGIPPAGGYAMTGGYNLYNTDAATPYIFGMSKTFFDSPATTSTINYKVQVSHSHGGSGAIVYVNRRGSSANWTSISTLTLWEVSG